MKIYCGTCGTAYWDESPLTKCTHCKGNLKITYDYEKVNWSLDQGNMWRYRDLLPVRHPASIVTLGEGSTPLIPSYQAFQARVYLKDETRNPTGSMKDRALSVAFSKAKEFGVSRSMLASTGSAGISAAAYAARANVKNTVLVPQGTPMERLVSMHMFGSSLIEVNATIEELVTIVKEVCLRLGWLNVSTDKSCNPYQSEASKTIAYEIFEQLGQLPNYVLVPVGGAGNFCSIWQGFNDLVRLGLVEKEELPRMIAVHHQHYNSLERALQLGLQTTNELLSLAKEMDDTLPCAARNIQHTFCLDGEEALQVIRDSNGLVVSVSDQEILDAQKSLSEIDGIFAEPSSAAATAAIQKLERVASLSSRDLMVAVITGSGLRETKLAIESHRPTISKVDKVDCIDYFFHNKF